MKCLCSYQAYVDSVTESLFNFCPTCGRNLQQPVSSLRFIVQCSLAGVHILENGVEIFTGDDYNEEDAAHRIVYFANRGVMANGCLKEIASEICEAQGKIGPGVGREFERALSLIKRLIVE